MAQVNKIKIRRGLNVDLPAGGTEAGELRYSTDTKELYIDDGAANIKIASEATAGALDSDLTAIAALTPTNDDVIQRKAGAWTNRTPAQVKTDLGLSTGDSPTFVNLTLTGVLRVDGGDGAASFTAASVSLGYSNLNQYQHFIHTRHNGGTGVNNAIDFYTSDGTAAGVYPTNAVHGLSINNGVVSIGTTSPDASAALQVDSTTKGFRPPKMTETQRDAIASPDEGLEIYNTTTHKKNVFTGSVWEEMTSS